MPDREKVIKGLEVCTSISYGETCPKDCPYYQEVCYGYDQLMRDALSLLKEQEAVAPVIYSETMNTLEGTYAEISIAYCGNCGREIDIQNHKDCGYNYCPKCGKEVKWNA